MPGWCHGRGGAHPRRCRRRVVHGESEEERRVGARPGCFEDAARSLLSTRDFRAGARMGTDKPHSCRSTEKIPSWVSSERMLSQVQTEPGCGTQPPPGYSNRPRTSSTLGREAVREGPALTRRLRERRSPEPPGSVRPLSASPTGHPAEAPPQSCTVRALGARQRPPALRPTRRARREGWWRRGRRCAPRSLRRGRASRSAGSVPVAPIRALRHRVLSAQTHSRHPGRRRRRTRRCATRARAWGTRGSGLGRGSAALRGCRWGVPTRCRSERAGCLDGPCPPAKASVSFTAKGASRSVPGIR